MDAILLAGFILGLTSNFHCLGMCGPIAMAIPVNRSSNLSIVSGILQYNVGRILTYGILGAIVGSIGVTIETLGFLQWISIITGVFMILFAWRKWIAARIESKLPSFGLNGLVVKGIGSVIASGSPFKLFLLGGLNGLLPCGMVYVGLMNALLGGNLLSGSYAMIAFGIGTLPAMLVVGFAANRISTTYRQKLNRLVPYLLTVVGILVVLRGLNLDIPYISPKVSVQTVKEKSADAETHQEVEMSCCHKQNSCKK